MISRLVVITLVLTLVITLLPFINGGWTDTNQYIVLNLQLPVTITAALVGASLCASAASLQMYLRNPLADPGIIGVSSGASLVAAIGLLAVPLDMQFSLQYWLPVACFIGALISAGLIIKLAKALNMQTGAVILAGLAISVINGAIVTWLYVFADAQSLRNLAFWLMGSLHQVEGLHLAVAGPIMLIALIAQVRNAALWNAWYMGEKTAQSMGVDTQKLSFMTLIWVSLSVGAAVSISGTIAFVGLLVPHVVRLWLGFDNRIVIPVSACLGACLLLCIALINTLLSSLLLPVSLMTASVGGPLFIFLLLKNARQQRMLVT